MAREGNWGEVRGWKLMSVSDGELSPPTHGLKWPLSFVNLKESLPS